ncbi:hypothetical protein AB4Y77_01880 [Paenarthrobacter sp. YAF11_1]|uniref:hypothetical protein n=1 Tax=Paenarthrobacter sp. YAF11_1 TaxID=3233074 RepID=UPI003F9E5C5A
MDTNQLLATVFTTLGTSGALLWLVKGAVKFFDGTAGRERIRNKSMKDQRNEERDRAEREALNRRRTEEYASRLRRFCTEEHGTDPDEFPRWPQLVKEPKQTN